MTMVPTIVATSGGTGWTVNQSKATMSVDELNDKIQFHPDTPVDDPLFVKFGGSVSKN